jgi:hypothetical protein
VAAMVLEVDSKSRSRGKGGGSLDFDLQVGMICVMVCGELEE